MDTVAAYLTGMVEWGGKYYVDEDSKQIIRFEDDANAVVVVGDESKKLVIPYEGMPFNKDEILFNPLPENIGEKRPIENVWFLGEFYTNIGELTKAAMHRILEIHDASGKDPSQEEMLVAKDFETDGGKLVTEALFKELDSIPALRILSPRWDRRTKTIGLKTALDNEEFVDKLKIRKRSIKLFRKLLYGIFATEDFGADFTFSAEIVGMPEIETHAKLMSAISQSAGDVFQTLLKVPMHAGILQEGIQYLKEMRRVSTPFKSAVIIAGKNDRDSEREDALAASKLPMGAPVQQQAQPVGVMPMNTQHQQLVPPVAPVAIIPPKSSFGRRPGEEPVKPSRIQIPGNPNVQAHPPASYVQPIPQVPVQQQPMAYQPPPQAYGQPQQPGVVSAASQGQHQSNVETVRQQQQPYQMPQQMGYRPIQPGYQPMQPMQPMQQPYGQPPQPYGQPQQAYGQPQQPYMGQPMQPQQFMQPQQPYGQQPTNPQQPNYTQPQNGGYAVSPGMVPGRY